jgi:hypothetical protein
MAFQRLTTGLKSLICPLCLSDRQRLVRAQQSWTDDSDYLSATTQVEMVFLCKACDRCWRFQIGNENESTGEVIVNITGAETVNAEHTRLLGLSPAPSTEEP